MRLRHIIETCAALALAAGVSAPALAQDHMHGGPGQPGMDMPPAPPPPAWKADRPVAWPAPAQASSWGIDPRAREGWLMECRRRIAVRDDGLGGAVIGGLIGGVAGNRIAGRHHRTTGTIAGAAAGAIAGAVIDKAEDRGSARDECERYLDEYYAYYAQAQQRWNYVPAYMPVQSNGCGCTRPAAVAPMRPAQNCTETVEYEYEYVEVPRRPKIRYIPRRPDKRIRVVPDKRIPQ